LGAFLCLFVALATHDSGMEKVRAEAVKEGKAEYVVINEYGKTEFRWKK
jgi:hypothetical protein